MSVYAFCKHLLGSVRTRDFLRTTVGCKGSAGEDITGEVMNGEVITGDMDTTGTMEERDGMVSYMVNARDGEEDNLCNLTWSSGRN